MQSRLSSLGSGLEVMGVVIEAIHPPAAAASAYQGVQTAQIRSIVRIANAKAAAARTLNDARSAATSKVDQALAAAAERVNGAQAELALFTGDRRAYATGGQSFLLERRLQHLEKTLGTLPLVIIDHRINKSNTPLLDLRPFAAPEAAVPEDLQ
jgi:regulator of protease activity HflC (stomatin/prohibitin superfamily)